MVDKVTPDSVARDHSRAASLTQPWPVNAHVGRRSIYLCIAAGLLAVAAGCATSQRVPRPDGSLEYRISCGYFGWYICHDKAEAICPGRYKVVSESEESYRKELRIACPGGARPLR